MTRPIPPAEAERCSRCGRLLTDPPLSWDPTSGSLDGCHIPPGKSDD